MRAIRQLTDAAFAGLSPQFDRLYSTIGRPSIPPEQLLRALASVELVDWMLTFTATAYNLVRVRTIGATCATC